MPSAISRERPDPEKLLPEKPPRVQGQAPAPRTQPLELEKPLPLERPVQGREPELAEESEVLVVLEE
jgi:hypothetical protein